MFMVNGNTLRITELYVSYHVHNIKWSLQPQIITLDPRPVRRDLQTRVSGTRNIRLQKRTDFSVRELNGYRPKNAFRRLRAVATKYCARGEITKRSLKYFNQ
jgi:hypothetical protein